MKYFSSFQPSLFLFSLLISMGLVISGCVTTKETSAPDPLIQQYDELERVNEQLAEELKVQRQLSAQLQMSLLEKHAEVNKLTLMNEHLIRDFVRKKSKFRTRGDKVETVSLLAEMATLIDTVKESRLTGIQQSLLTRAEQYQAESRIELENGNFDGASYLAGQAMKEVEAIQLEGRSNEQQGNASIVHFLAPLPMVLLKGSNVRKDPAITAKVKRVLESGTDVTAVGYKGEWVKVKMQGQESGWIHYSLLCGARK